MGKTPPQTTLKEVSQSQLASFNHEQQLFGIQISAKDHKSLQQATNSA